MRLLAILLVLGCGSSSKSSTTPEAPESPADKQKREAREAREKRRQEIEAMKPKDPYELRDKRAFAPTDRCGQGPYRIETDTLKAKYGERVSLYACGKAIKGNYRMTTSRSYGGPDTFERSFGDRADNEACKGKAVEVVTAGAASSTSGGGARGEQRGGPTAAAPEKVESHTLAKSDVPLECRETSIMHSYGWQTSDGVAIDGKITFDVWSDVPNDLEGLVFVVARYAVAGDMTRERWKQYGADYDAWYEVYKAFHDEQLAHGDWTVVDNSVKTPPPPKPRAETPPPKPSKNARWIPGYWHYAETKFHWIAGLWDVPEEDVKQELTVQAPTPPPVRAPSDVPPERPTVTAVWTPGSWYWDGRAYVWIAGAWRIPPSAQQTWQAPTWTVRTGRSIYVPGGWRIRIGR